MQRRELVRLIGTAMALPAFSGWSPERLWALGERTHGRTAGFRGRLSPRELETVAVMAELILPRSDTPGARDVGVPGFIDLLMTEWYDDEQCARFLTGLAAIDTLASARGAGEFIDLGPAHQVALVDSLDASLSVPESPEPGSAESAYRTLKSLAVFAYFTSREVQRDILKVNIWPNRYDGCIPV